MQRKNRALVLLYYFCESLAWTDQRNTKSTANSPVLSCTNRSKTVTDLLGTFSVLENFYPTSGSTNAPSAEIIQKVVQQGTKQQAATFDGRNNALIEHAQLYTPRRGYPFQLEVTVPDNKVTWGLWQMTGTKNQKAPVEFWSEALQSSTIHYTPIEKKQILAVVWAAQETKRNTGQDSATVLTPIAIHGWVTDDSLRTHTGVAWAVTYWE